MCKVLTTSFILAVFLLPFVVQADESDIPSTVKAGAKLVEVYSADAFFEGPTWDPQTDKLYFTSFRGKNTQILRLDAPGMVSVWAEDTEGVNGTYLSLEGRILGAQAYGHRVMSYAIGSEGPSDIRVLAVNTEWNQPNDICQTPNGNIYFTDPQFGKREASAVFLMTPAGKITKIITEMPTPNGLIASNDGRTLYVSDSHEKLWRSYPILDNGSVGKGRIFFNPDTAHNEDPDGVSIDEKGNLYLTGRGGVWVATPEAISLGLISVPVFCSNVTFGGTEGMTLYLTCSKKVYSLEMNVRGGHP